MTAGASMTGASTMTGADTGADTTGTGGEPEICPGEGQGTAAVGDGCTANSECASGVCTLFADVPRNEDAVCAEVPENCGTRVTATVYDFATGEPLGGANVRVAKAVDAISNPMGAVGLAEAISGSDGRIDVTTEAAVSSPFGIVALVDDAEHFFTATGVSAPNDDGAYEVGTGIHEFWAVSQASLTAWSEALEGDADIPGDALPLGTQGGVIGFVRDASTGAPLVGAGVVGEKGSSAVIRILADDGTFDATVTGETGIFVVIGAQTTGEDFVAQIDGVEVGRGTAGSAAGVAFTLIVDADAG
jgi:5-hydroxyisourate hydrolase-like protein (transthyretin family)